MRLNDFLRLVSKITFQFKSWETSDDHRHLAKGTASRCRPLPQLCSVPSEMKVVVLLISASWHCSALMRCPFYKVKPAACSKRR